LTLAAAKLGKDAALAQAQDNAQNPDDPLATCRKLRRWRHLLCAPPKDVGNDGHDRPREEIVSPGTGTKN
jgi:hypothetical protein